MESIIDRDIRTFPDLFLLSGPIDSQLIPSVLCGAEVPDDLRRFWVKYGGVEAFESEDILAPSSDPEGVEASTAYHSALIPGSMSFVFHVGYCVSVVLSDGGYVAIASDSGRRLGRFSKLDEWYVEILRDEFRSRYGV